MKRRDWKIKKLKKTFFDNHSKKKTNYYFIRELFLRKNNVLLKKNTSINFNFYRNVLACFKQKSNYVQNIYFAKNVYLNFLVLFPNFFFSKKIFQSFNFSTSFFANNNILSIFIKQNKNDLKISKKSENLNKLSSNNIVLFKKNNSNFDIKSIIDEDNLKIFSLKNYILNNQSKINDLSHFSFFINYNLYLFNLAEIYKILCIIYIYKL